MALPLTLPSCDLNGLDHLRCSNSRSRATARARRRGGRYGAVGVQNRWLGRPLRTVPRTLARPEAATTGGYYQSVKNAQG